jgi:hypothetical protein
MYDKIANFKFKAKGYFKQDKDILWARVLFFHTFIVDLNTAKTTS